MLGYYVFKSGSSGQLWLMDDDRWSPNFHDASEFAREADAKAYGERLVDENRDTLYVFGLAHS